jgi:menaquinone-specific isochorismate synthase
MAMQVLVDREGRRSSARVPSVDDWPGEVDIGGGDEYSVERHGRLVSASRPLAGLPVERFLQAAQGQERFFWRDGKRGIAFAGMGVAAHLMGYGRSRFSAIQRQASELFTHSELETGPLQAPPSALALPRLFGGFSFREAFIPDVVWTGFNPAPFILPNYQLVTQGGQSWLTINALLPHEETAAANLPLLHEALDIRIELLQEGEKNAGTERAAVGNAEHSRVKIDYPLPYSEWAQMIEKAKGSFASTPLQKVVLSRIAQLRAPQPIGILPALSHLCARYPGCFSFLFEPQPGHAFLGATPELLVQVQGARLETMALAGSIQRGATAAEDAKLAQELLTSAKDRHEHQLVVSALRQRLQPLTSQLTIADGPTVLTLSNIQHLFTPVTGTLKRQSGALPLVEALHPTPALGGSPRDLALAFIHAHEPTLRGWYAAPVGWIDSSLEGAFAVAIRSAVVQKERAWAYAGAGIIGDSVPQKEWEETDWKFQPIIDSVVGSQPL